MNPANQWRYVYRTVVGTSHSSRNLSCQDYSLISELTAADTAPVLLLITSDGAGSASRADVGAKLVCDSVYARSENYIKQHATISSIDKELVQLWIDEWICDLYKQAAREELNVREFACTLICALIGIDTAIFFQIGDGAIVVGEGDGYRHIFWPQNGEYANSTYFVTDDNARDNLQFDKIDNSIVDEIALFTDGLQNLALKFDTRSAHNPFFHPLFARLRSEPPGESVVLTPLLQDFLSSPAVNERTDDDKTLLLATRRVADSPQTEENGRPSTAI